MNEKIVDLFFAGALFAIALVEYAIEARRVARSANVTERIFDYAA